MNHLKCQELSQIEGRYSVVMVPGLLRHKHKDDSAQVGLLLLFTGRCCEMGLGALEMFF